jgi:hypothetical protein
MSCVKVLFSSNKKKSYVSLYQYSPTFSSAMIKYYLFIVENAIEETEQTKQATIKTLLPSHSKKERFT